MKEKVVLAYSGGLDTTAIIPWLKENYDYEVICCCVDVGQGNELDGLEDRAKLSGATKLYIEDVVDELPLLPARLSQKNWLKSLEKKAQSLSATVPQVKVMIRSVLSYPSWHWLRILRSSLHGVSWIHGKWIPAKMRSSTAKITALTFRFPLKTATAVTVTYGTSAMKDWN